MFPSRDSAQDNWQRVLWDAAFKRGSESLVAVLEDLHKPVMRMVPDGEVETCDSCSQIATMECVEYVHLIEYPCPTIVAIHKARSGD